MTILLIWGFATLIYALFWAWYVGFNKPITQDEIEKLISMLTDQGTEPERIKVFREFFESDDGKEFIMLNCMELREPKAEARKNLKIYSNSFMANLLKRAGHPIFFGKVAGDNIEQWNINTGPWDSAALVRYRSRRDLLEMMYIAIGDLHDYKIRALGKTFAYPVKPLINTGNLRILVALVLALFAAFANIIYLLHFHP